MQLRSLQVLMACLWLCLSQAGHAQLSGYLGKETIVGIRAGMFPNIWQSVQNNMPVALNLQSGLQVEQLLSRRFSVGANLQFLSTKSFYNLDQITGTMTIRGVHAGVDIRSYMIRKRGNIPPVGPHHQFGLSYLDYVVNDNNRRYLPSGASRIGRYQAGVLNYTLATNRVWFDRLVGTAGVGLSWVVPFSPSTFPDQDNYIWARSVSRLRGFFGWQITLGLGWLI